MHLGIELKFKADWVSCWCGNTNQGWL